MNLGKCGACGVSTPMELWQRMKRCPSCNSAPSAPPPSGKVIECPACHVLTPAEQSQCRGCQSVFSKMFAPAPGTNNVRCPVCQKPTPPNQGRCLACGSRMEPTREEQAAQQTRICSACGTEASVHLWNMNGACPKCMHRPGYRPANARYMAGDEIITCPGCHKPTPNVGQCLCCGGNLREMGQPETVSCTQCGHAPRVSAWQRNGGACPACRTGTPAVSIGGGGGGYVQDVIYCDVCGVGIDPEGSDYAICNECQIVTSRPE